MSKHRIDRAVLRVLAWRPASVDEVALILRIGQSEALRAVTRLLSRGLARGRYPIDDPPRHEADPAQRVMTVQRRRLRRDQKRARQRERRGLMRTHRAACRHGPKIGRGAWRTAEVWVDELGRAKGFVGTTIVWTSGFALGVTGPSRHRAIEDFL